MAWSDPAWRIMVTMELLDMRVTICIIIGRPHRQQLAHLAVLFFTRFLILDQKMNDALKNAAFCGGSAGRERVRMT